MGNCARNLFGAPQLGLPLSGASIFQAAPQGEGWATRCDRAVKLLCVPDRRLRPWVLRGRGQESATLAFEGTRATGKVAGLSPERKAAFTEMVERFLGA